MLDFLAKASLLQTQRDSSTLGESVSEKLLFEEFNIFEIVTENVETTNNGNPYPETL